MVRDPEIFEGDLAENVHLRRVGVTQHDVRHALAEVGLLYDLLKLPSGLETHITAAGAPLSDTQQLLLMFARAIVAQPQLLLVDGALDRLPDADLERVLQVLADPSRPWTLVVTTGKRAIASMLDRAIQLEGHVPVATRTGKAPPPR
jgi:ABC-type bacteriocin/lantibiotic exporter with double-glycine peptidase domain